MAIYGPLSEYLAAQGKAVSLRFSDIERIINRPLPASARKYPAWWSNSGGSHVQALAWLDVGFRTQDVDLTAERLTFLPVRQPEGLVEMERAGPTTPSGRTRASMSGFGEMKQAKLDGDTGAKKPASKEKKPHPLFGIWKGLVTLDPDYDYTQPADPDWGKVYDE